VVILDQGRVLAEGTPQDLCRQYATGGQPATLEDVFLRVSGKRLEEDVEGEEVGS
jgi:ABC-type multidrug transport system ATPase subunit